MPKEVWWMWGIMALAYLGGCLSRWRREKRQAARERAAWEEVSL